MADNVNVTGGSGEVIAADDIAGVKFQRVKIVLGADGVNGGDVATTNAMPVTGPLTDTQLRATPVPVSGTVTATGPLTDTQLRATPVPVSGTVTATGPLTDTQLRATPVPVSGTVTANTGLAQPLTDAQLRATAVPVSGTVTANTGLTQPLTDTQLRATPVPVSGTVTANLGTIAGVATAANQTTEIGILNTIATNTGAQATDTLQSGTITALNGAVTINAQGAYTVTANLSGTWVATLVAEGLMADGTTWVQLPFYVVQTVLPYPASLTATLNGQLIVTGGGYTSIRIRASAFTSGTVNVALNASLAQQTIFSAQLGSWSVSAVPVDGVKISYSASVTALGAGTVTTDVFRISGSGTRTVRVTRLALTATQTTAAQRDIVLIKRSTANTGGTTVAAAAVAHDSSNAAATATVVGYTANAATVGTVVGSAVRTRKVFIGTTTANSDELIIDFGVRPSQAIVLRGTAEGLSINLNGVASAGGSFNISVEWTEE